jgi:hypothetical protein
VLGTIYTYEVRAINAIGGSIPSNELVLQAGTNPCPPSNVETALNADGELAIITWDPAPCDNGLVIQGYQVFIRDGQRFPEF